MKVNTIAAAAILALGLASCKSAQTTSTTKGKVPYVEANHYFVRNDVTDFSPRKITSKEELEKFFGYAAVMSSDGSGLPTNIDFSKQYVLAVILPQTDKDTDIKVKSLTHNGNKVVLAYKVVTKGEPKSYSTIPFTLLVVDKKYGTDAEFELVK